MIKQDRISFENFPAFLKFKEGGIPPILGGDGFGICFEFRASGFEINLSSRPHP
jgi:hypothetical protein